jgi:PAS domain S-box-containing protein
MVRPRADDARKTKQDLTVPDSDSGSRGGSYSSPLELLPATLDAVSDGLVIVDSHGCCRYLNESAAASLGQTPETILGRPVWTHLPEDLGRRLREACELAIQGARPARLLEHQPDLGGWLEIRVFPHGGDVMLTFRDRNAEQLADDELAEDAESISEAERIVGFGMWRWELASGRVRWSDELHRIYGLRPGEFGGTVDAFLSFLHPDDRDRVWANIARALDTLAPFVFEERIVRPDGEVRVLLSKGRVLAGSDRSPVALVGVCHDVTERARIERALGASERRMRAIMNNSPSIISVKDLAGRYLMVNAEYGRLLGLSPDEIVGQHCADLFPAEIAEAQRANDRRAVSEGEPAIGELVLDAGGERRTYLTTTFVLPDDDGFPAETCMIATDVTERHDYESARRERAAWQERITSALDEDRMVVYAQPIIDLRTGAQLSSELLVRMQTAGDRTRILAPGDFLPAAERFGFVQAIDIWMVRQATMLSGDVQPEVNLSAVTMCDPAARREILEVLSLAPEAAGRIVFEITETAAASHLEAAQAFAETIEGLGCRLALDDFGTGFGSFTYLRSLPLSFIKIDLSFVRGLVDSRQDRRVVGSIIGIAQQFGLATIAEGVEDQATQELLRELGADYAQGFFLGRPAPITIPQR